MDPVPSETSSSGDQVCYENVKLGRAHWVILKLSEFQRNPFAPTFEERSIEWTLYMEEMTRKSAWTLHKNFAQFLFHILRINISSWNGVPSSGASLQKASKMIWVQRSKKRFQTQRMHQTGWFGQYISVMWACLFKFYYWKNHPRYFRCANGARKTVIRMNGIQINHHISSRMVEHRV